MKKEVYSITQLGAMKNWLTAIIQDINNITDLIYQTICNNKKLNDKIDLMDFEILEMNKNVQDLQEQRLSLNKDTEILHKKIEIGKK